MNEPPQGPPPPFSASAATADGLWVPIGSTDTASLASSSAPRRWDDPPEEEPPQEQDHVISMVFVAGQVIPSLLSREIQQISFTPAGNFLVTLVPLAGNFSSTHEDGSTLQMYNFPSCSQVSLAAPGRGIRVHGSFSTAHGASTLSPSGAVASAWHTPIGSGDSGIAANTVEIYDMWRSRRRLKANVPLQAPLALSQDGTRLAAVSARDSTRIMIANVGKEMLQMSRLLPYHLGEVTHLRFVPDGSAVVSVARDGSFRMTSVTTGRTLLKVELDMRMPASMMEVSLDGRTAVAVWGREVTIWNLQDGNVIHYNINQSRHHQTEGWPMAISPDCKYLLCRTEDGFDVADVETGRFRGDFVTGGSPLTAGGFSPDNKWIAVGNYNGQVSLFQVITV
ncbi:WD40-repeat-containing domain protein [Podospora didyma]|uniref:WD40-repeat-containing domain protein n=1 Tax=Podospora didyma TaxID=330526 RepID=A0AAE0K8F2_9PEZI|nr:WD40-repeat-containing domain protein [Podospora didyma]